MTSTADAVDREAAWLNASGDGLPALLASAGGPWDIIQPYMARTPATAKKQIFVMRRRIAESRFAAPRKIDTYPFHLNLWWPIGATTTGVGIAEAEQRALDAAIELLLERIRGYPTDHSHGGRFLSVAEAPVGAEIAVDFGDPVQGIANGVLTATATYSADDQDYTA
ncbi:hypothetical protein P3T35_003170 [Kitasatospora sp. GP30]|uniref:hypothetical protein n=1 Tax=Kitasatospora sp. GP30 TaxID=3035084 RepID=UPI000CBD7AD9|nr:hypothetical protein [Kitasatospora sp. GP30]MDH6141157.1 hypothetical protein [Kitasatospora sp. GP30]